jgi:hypothetical protein
MTTQTMTTDEITTISRSRRVRPEEIEAWVHHLHAEHAPEIPRQAFNRIYSRAYATGHSDGYWQVEQDLIDYVELVSNVLGDLSVRLP